MYRSPSPYGAPPPLQDPSYTSQAYGNSYGNAQPSPAGSSPVQIAPGTVTYTTSPGPDGRLVYHPFKAVAASYQTPSGIVSGIQWVPAEATSVLPPGAMPANTDFAESWRRGHLSKDDQRALKDWQRQEDKRRRREEKESSRMLRDKERYRSDDAELRAARERDAVARERRKSFSAPAGGVPFPGGPPGAVSPGSAYGGSAYGDSPYGGYPDARGAVTGGTPYGRERKYSQGAGAMADLDRQFGELGMDADAAYQRQRTISGRYAGTETPGGRPRALSGNYGSAGVERPAAYSTGAPSPYIPPRPYSRGPPADPPGAYPPSNMAPYPSASANIYPPPAPGARSPYGPTGPGGYPTSTTGNPYPTSATGNPYPGASANPYPPSGSVYSNPSAGGRTPDNVFVPPLPGDPMPRMGGAYSRPGSPMHRPRSTVYPAPAAPTIERSGSPYAPDRVSFPQPTVQGFALNSPSENNGQLQAPEGFSRPLNAALPYTPFEAMKVSDMDELLMSLPRMPVVLSPHDVYTEDWDRMLHDLSLAWAGKLPVPQLGGRSPKRATLASQIIDLWNSVFFVRRGVEVVLYKGRERRSGPNAGVADLPHHLLQDDFTSSTSESSDDDDDDNLDDERYASGAYNVYGRQPYGTNQAQMMNIAEARRRRQEARAERRRRRKQKKMRRKVKERERKYGLYITCVHQSAASSVSPNMQPASLHGFGGPGY